MLNIACKPELDARISLLRVGLKVGGERLNQFSFYLQRVLIFLAALITLFIKPPILCL